MVTFAFIDTLRKSFKGVIHNVRLVGKDCARFFKENRNVTNPSRMYYAASQDQREGVVDVYKRGGYAEVGQDCLEIECPITACPVNLKPIAFPLKASHISNHREVSEHMAAHLHHDIVGRSFDAIDDDPSYLLAASMFNTRLERDPRLAVPRHTRYTILGTKSGISAIQLYNPKRGQHSVDSRAVLDYTFVFEFRRSCYDNTGVFIGSDEDWETLRSLTMDGTRTKLIDYGRMSLRNDRSRCVRVVNRDKTVSFEDTDEEITSEEVTNGGEDEENSTDDEVDEDEKMEGVSDIDRVKNPPKVSSSNGKASKPAKPSKASKPAAKTLSDPLSKSIKKGKKKAPVQSSSSSSSDSSSEEERKLKSKKRKVHYSDSEEEDQPGRSFAVATAPSAASESRSRYPLSGTVAARTRSATTATQLSNSAAVGARRSSGSKATPTFRGGASSGSE